MPRPYPEHAFWEVKAGRWRPIERPWHCDHAEQQGHRHIVDCIDAAGYDKTARYGECESGCVYVQLWRRRYRPNGRYPYVVMAWLDAGSEHRWEQICIADYPSLIDVLAKFAPLIVAAAQTLHFDGWRALIEFTFKEWHTHTVDGECQRCDLGNWPLQAAFFSAARRRYWREPLQDDPNERDKRPQQET